MAPMFDLLRRVGWRRLREEPFRLALTVMGVSLGVAVYLAIQLANDSALRAFRNSLDAISGKTHLQVGAGDRGIPEDLYLSVRDLEGMKHATPVIQQTAWLRKFRPGVGRWIRGTETQGRAVLVLGVDLLGDSYFRQYTPQKEGSLEETLSKMADPRGVFLTQQLAEELGIQEGDTVQIDAASRLPFRVRGILKPSGLSGAMEGRVALMDIGVAQEAFARLGRLDRIDLILSDPKRLEEGRRAVQAVLPNGVVVERPVRRGEDVERMLSSFRLNLTVLSIIALLVGCFLIFNAMSAAVVRRKAEIGILRSLGMTSRQILGLIAAEATIIGLVGSAMGIALGILLAKGTLTAVSQTIRNLYVFLKVSDVYISPSLIVWALVAGTGVALVSSLGPALSAARVSPAQISRRDSNSFAFRRSFLTWTLIWAAIAGLAALGLGRLPVWTSYPLFGYLSALLVVVSLALFSPALIEGGARVLRRALGRETIGWLASHGLGRHPGRNAVTVASLATAISMLASLVIMVESFRDTVAVWTDQSLKADLYAAPASRFIKGSAASFSNEAREKVAGVEGVAAVDGFRAIRIPWKGTQIEVAGADFGVAAVRSRLPFLEGETRAVMLGAKQRGEAIITETFANRFSVKKGDIVRLPGPSGEVSLRIAGVYYDYSTGGGLLIVDRVLFRQIWGDERLSSMAIYLKSNADQTLVRQKIEAMLDEGMVLISNAGLRRRVLDVFDQTFAITYALEAIAVLVALLGVATGLSSNILERRREIGTLRALGLTKRGVEAAVIGEAGLLGLLSALLGAAAGVGLGAILVFVINKQSFGWTIQFGVPVVSLVVNLSIVILAALIAGWIPARMAANTAVAEAVREE